MRVKLSTIIVIVNSVHFFNFTFTRKKLFFLDVQKIVIIICSYAIQMRMR